MGILAPNLAIFLLKKANLPENTLFYINQGCQSFKDGKNACASTKRDRKLRIEYCVALVTVRNDLEERFFYYGYHKENFKVLYSTRKLKVPNSFKTTIFGQHKLRYEGGAFDEQKFSKLFFYLAATVDRNEKINKYLTSVHLKPFHVDLAAVFGE